jgi:glutathione S-transferase
MSAQIEKYLAAQPASYFSGTSKPGIGDFMMFFAVHSLLMGSRKDGGYVVGPATRAWLDKVLAR